MRGFIYIDACILMLHFSLIGYVSSRMIHEYMTPDEVAETFGRIENLPEYQVMPIYYSHVKKRAVNGKVSLELKPFGNHIKLWLEPSDGILFSDETPIYSVSSSSKGPQYARLTDAMKTLTPAIYSHYDSYTTVAVNRGANRARRMSGVIGSHNIVIRPLPERLVHNVTKHRRSIDGIPESEQDDHHYHIVYKSAVNDSLQPFKSSLRMRRSDQDIVYPEILVIVDYNLYKVFKQKWYNLVLYLMAFWNGVDMMYRALEHPKYRLNIAAILIAEDNYALKYLTSNRLGHDKLEFNKALDDSQYWLYDQLNPIIDAKSYDIAVTMTSLTLCDARDVGIRDSGTLGVAYVSGTCKVDDYFHKVIKTAIVHDIGAFTGINTAGHELGHSFGASHDGNNQNIRCSGTVGNIMAAHTSMTQAAADWSRCTLHEFQNFLQTDGKCLYNKPKRGASIVKLLPGKMKDANKQCEILQGTKAAEINGQICQKLGCIKRDNPHLIIAEGGAADGTPCGKGQMCLHGKCINESSVTY